MNSTSYLIVFFFHFTSFKAFDFFFQNTTQDAATPNRTLDLASALEVGTTGNKTAGDNVGQSGSTKSVMTIAFQFAFEVHLQDSVAAMARQYVRSIIASVQRVALALSPSHFGSQNGLRPPPGTPEAQTLAQWICNSHRYVMLNSDFALHLAWYCKFKLNNI